MIFLMSFMLLGNICYANEFDSAAKSSASFTVSSAMSSNTYAGYSSTSIVTILSNYKNDAVVYGSEFNHMISEIENAGYTFVIGLASDVDEYVLIITKRSAFDLGFFNNKIYFISDSYSTSSVTALRSISKKSGSATVYADKASYFNVDFDCLLYSTKPVKQLFTSLIWDGESYYYQSSDTPSGNYDLAGLITAITSSDVIKDNTNGYLSDYFIIPKGTVGDEEVYSVYFYHKLVNLSKFDYVYEDVNYYDLDKLSGDNGVINILDHYRKSFESDILDKARHFTIYYNPNTKASDIYLTSNTLTLNNLKSFLSDSEPIIYTTKLIKGYFATWGETDTEWTATEDSTRDILVTEVSDSEGNVISSSIVRDNISVSETPFERFISIIGGIPTTILNGIKSLFVPDSEYFPSQFERLKTALNNKLPTSSIISIMETLKDVQAGEMSPITIELYGHTYTLVDFSYYEQYKTVIYNWVRGFVYFFLLLYWGSQFYKLLRGDTLSGNAFTFGQMGLKESIGFRTEGRK